ncbi:MAG: ATP-binding protein [Acidimicrobiaceae bacterium]|nr:ATP-binding protein [Acidimicrobiaceae bacterium]
MSLHESTLTVRPRNPFAPTFGAEPPLLVGRDEILQGVVDAWATGPTHPGYTTLLLGRRGAGKTVVLEALRTRGGDRGWLSISAAAATSGLLNRLGHGASEHLNRNAPSLAEDIRADLAAASIGLGSAYDPGADLSRRLAIVLKALATHLQAHGAGLLITVDELHAGETDELRMLGVVIQDVTRVGQLPMAFVGAGLPLLEDTLLADTSVTFLQRCARYEIDFLEPTEAWTALAEPVRERGGRMPAEAVEHAVAVSQGYPFMVQLVGFHAWQAALDPTTAVTLQDVAAGAETARRQVGQLVIAPMWRDLSEGSRRFLAAMALDDGPSRTSDIAIRLGVSGGYVGVYRHRLMKSGLVAAAGHGRLDFALEAARPWIRGLDEYQLLCETLKLADGPSVGFARPRADREPES